MSQALIDQIAELKIKLEEAEIDAARYRMKRLIDFMDAKGTCEQSWNSGYDVAVDYCVKHGLPHRSKPKGEIQ